jgi:putative transposase
MSGVWVKQPVRDDVVRSIDRWHSLSGKKDKWFRSVIGVAAERLSDWRRRFGCPNAPAGNLPKSHWLSESERKVIVVFYLRHPGEGYRRCAYMMVDEDVAYASPSTVYRILNEAGVIERSNARPSLKGTGFAQPHRPHEHWHTDITYIKVSKRFYYLVCVLDGYSRYIVNWGLRESMEDKDVAVVQQRAVEKHPGEKTRYITDNGGQFAGKEFRKFIAFHGLTHARTSPNYPQSNGKIERFHGSIKGECVKRKALTSKEQAEAVIGAYIDHYNNKRLHSAIGYVAPVDKLEGRDGAIREERAAKLHTALTARKKVGKSIEHVCKTKRGG